MKCRRRLKCRRRCWHNLMPISPFRKDGWLPAGHHKAEWDEISARFGGRGKNRRASLTTKLLELYQAPQAAYVSGTILLDVNCISKKTEPEDFDVPIVGPTDLQTRKDTEPNLTSLSDAASAETQRYSLFFVTEASPMRKVVSGIWDFSKEGIVKGAAELAH